MHPGRTNLPDVTIQNGRISTKNDEVYIGRPVPREKDYGAYPVKELSMANLNIGKILFCLIFALSFGTSGSVGIFFVSRDSDAPAWVYLELAVFALTGFVFLFIILRDISRLLSAKTAPKTYGVFLGYEDDPHLTINGCPAQIMVIRAKLGEKTMILKIKTGETQRKFRNNQRLAVRISKKNCLVEERKE